MKVTVHNVFGTKTVGLLNFPRMTYNDPFKNIQSPLLKVSREPNQSGVMSIHSVRVRFVIESSKKKFIR